MKKRPVRLPPLSADASNAVDKLERYAKQIIRECRSHGAANFNIERATRALRTCVTNSFIHQLKDYENRPGYCADWNSEIIRQVVASVIGIVSADSQSVCFREFLQEELEQTVSERLAQIQNARQPAAPKTPPDRVPATTRDRIDDFISRVTNTQRKINRKNIWTVAGYKDASEFERFQRDDSRTTISGRKVFSAILELSPTEFIERLDLKRSKRK